VKANAFSAFNEIINRHCGILADIMSHLNELIVELQEEKPTIFFLSPRFGIIMAFKANIIIFRNFWSKIKICCFGAK